MKKDKKFYVIELVILIFIIMFKMIFNKIPFLHSDIINIIFWFVMCILLYIIGGFPKDKNYYKKSSIKIIIIVFLFYILVTYLLGLFLGFVKNLYFYNFGMLFEKMLAIPALIIFTEISRYLFFKRNPIKIHIYIYTFLLIILNIIMEVNNYNIDGFDRLFIIVSAILLPVCVREILASYITYNVGLLPTIIYKLIFITYSYFVPFLPDLGDYLKAIFGLIVPYVIFREIGKNLRYKEKYGLYAKKTISYVSSGILFTFLIVIVLLVSGIFKYQLVAIASGSMEPVYYRGDAVIIEKINAKEVKIGDILVFKVGSGIVTHRVVEISQEDGKMVFCTKGDNNKTEDTFDIDDSDVKGIVKYVVKYLGYPTIMFNELLESK